MDFHSSGKPAFSRLKPPRKKHLKPLSLHSRMVRWDQNGENKGLNKPSDPFVNLKIKISNDSGRNRNDMNNDYNSPSEKQPRSHTLSPDLGCYMDYSSSPTRSSSMSPFSTLNPTVKKETQACRHELKDPVSSRLDLEHDQVRDSKDMEKTEEICKNMSPEFDLDIKDILCLNPPKQEGPPEKQGQFSFIIIDSIETVSGPLLGPMVGDEEFLEREEEVLNIGQPICESSICQPHAASEQQSGLSEARISSDTFYSDDFTLDSFYETTMPLQLQVKSKVVVPNRTNEAEQKDCSGEQNWVKTKRGRFHRPVLNNMECDYQKRQYIHSVRCHLNEGPSGAQGPMTELQQLMTQVAGQTRSDGHRWQHPSDLTCRNYQKRFRTETPTMTLRDWQAWNNRHYRRFSKVPKTFHRSQFP